MSTPPRKERRFYVDKPLYLHLYVVPFTACYAIAGGFIARLEDGPDFGFFAGVYLLPVILAHGLCWLGTFWSVHWECRMTMASTNDPKAATRVLIIPADVSSTPELCTIHKPSGSLDGAWFEFHKRKFTWSEERGEFLKPKAPVNLSFGSYLAQRGFAKQEAVDAAVAEWGENIFDVPKPTFKELYKEHATAPFFVFQIFCVGLWCLDDMWYYSVFTFFMLLLFEATVVKQRLRNVDTLRAMAGKAGSIQVFRGGRWHLRSTADIVPGDVVSIVRAKSDEAVVAADILLLYGSCVVNEAVLTGESLPQPKRPVSERDPDARLTLSRDSTADRSHVIFSGSRVVEHSADAELKSKTGMAATPDGGSLGYVLRTSFATSQGKLLRTILFSSTRATANTRESLVFILVLLVFALCAAVYVGIKGLEDPNRSRYKLLLNCTMVVTMVVPPELPMELSLAVQTSLNALRRYDIVCTEPFRIPFGGKVAVCCFDKTGTLTAEDLEFRGIVGDDLSDHRGSDHRGSERGGGGDMSPMPRPPDKLHPNTTLVLGGCQSLVHVGDELVGDPMERCALSALDWTVTKNDDAVERTGLRRRVTILRRFPFSSAVARMANVVQLECDKRTSFHALVKGAPDVIRPLLARVPDDYDATYKKFASQGARVITLAHKTLPQTSIGSIRSQHRGDIECDLEFAGMAVFHSPMKPDSHKALQLLKNSRHHLVMITGDQPLTACQVARELDMTSRPATLILTNGPTGLQWVAPDESEMRDFDNGDNLVSLLPSFDLCLSGDAIRCLYASHPTVAEQVILHTRVFARVDPSQKEAIVGTFKRLGHTVMMCGDGTNDVGALKQAHVGVALLHSVSSPAVSRPPPPSLSMGRGKAADRVQRLQSQLEQQMQEQNSLPQLGDASIASPFTSRRSSIMSVTHILRQGRCTLVITLQIFKILALNCLINAFSLSVLQLEGVKFGDKQLTFSGMMIALFFLFISQAQPKPVLANVHPPSSIFNLYFVLTVLGQFLLHLSVLVFVLQTTIVEYPRTETDLDVDADFQPNVLNSAVFLVSSLMQVSTFAVNYQGLPFMDSLFEHKKLIYCVGGVTLCIVVAALEPIPDFNLWLELVPMPTRPFKLKIIQAMAVDLFGSFAIDRVCRFLFYGASCRTPTEQLLRRTE